jgi:DNA-directed RNA polymerase subunit RPC12/RpoP
MTLEDERGKFRLLVCPDCGNRAIAQMDLIPGLAEIAGVYEDGTIEWVGETDVDWNGQRPASNPAEYVCLACNEKFSFKQLKVEDVNEEEKDTQPSTAQDDIDCVLQLARDELAHLEQDAEEDEGSAADYKASKAALERVEARIG